ncbi:MAG: hypothetical protein ABR576_12435 [Thermoanaerobaculia bacterium]
MLRTVLSAAAALALASAWSCAPAGTAPPDSSNSLQRMDGAAEKYVKLVLAAGEHDADLVDAFYGPAEWRKEAKAAKRSLSDLRRDADALASELQGMPAQKEEMHELRRRYMTRQLAAVTARLEMLSGTRLSFDEESRALYDAVAPAHGEEYFLELQAELEKELPGSGPLIDRYEAFRNRVLIPRERLDAVFDAAIAACRERTLKEIELPPGEAFTVEYVTGKTWSAYNWYQGGYRSVIQVNTDLPISIDRAIDLACHEGYPGHHVYNVLLEKHLVRDRGWVEFSVYPLFSPQSLIAEGSANFGIDVAFPGDQRVAFEKEKLYPLAGLDPALAEKYARVQELVDRLSHAASEAGRRYLDGRLDGPAMADWIARYGLWPKARAEQRVRFTDQYRSYVINYTLGQDMVREHIEAVGGTPENPRRRWDEFRKLLASPRLPSDLARKGARP